MTCCLHCPSSVSPLLARCEPSVGALSESTLSVTTRLYSSVSRRKALPRWYTILSRISPSQHFLVSAVCPCLQPVPLRGGHNPESMLWRKERRKVECTRCARPPPSRSRDASTSLSQISQALTVDKPSGGLLHRRRRSHSAASLPLCRRTRWDRPSWSAPSGTHYSKVPAVRSVAPHFRAIVSTVTAVPGLLVVVQSVGVVAGRLAMRVVACCLLLTFEIDFLPPALE